MSDARSVPAASQAGPPPLSWPPPGLERIQGRLWRVIGVSWIGSIILVLPLLWELAVEQPFWSLGPFGGDWQVGMTISALGMVILLVAFGSFFSLMKQAAGAAEAGFGTLTILEVATDVTRDTGFLIQGRRHFGSLEGDKRAGIVRARVRGASLVLSSALWLAVGFGLAVMAAARGFVTPSGIWLMTLGPTVLLLASGLIILFAEHARVRSVRASWEAAEGPDKVHAEADVWIGRLDEAGDAVVLGAGAKGEGARFRVGATVVVVLFLLTLIPTITVAVTAAIGPILAEIAVPTFLSVQEMAGAAETLRRYRIDTDPSITPAQAGAALQNIAFVGGGEVETWEKAPEKEYPEGWFPDSDAFPDPFTESVAGDLMARPLADFTPDEQAALRQAAANPAHEEFQLLSRAQLVDVVSGRWTLPFPDTLNFQSLPWPRFAAFRTAGLAQVARAAVEVSRGDRANAEETLRELISTGFLLVDQGPTLLDNLMGVVLVNMGGNALEAYYTRTGQSGEAQALKWAREGSTAAAHKARAGVLSEDIHSLLQGIPDLVESEDALRGLRWEYFATFNMLAPCINVHKMVFGPDDTYDEWRMRARDKLVRVRGEIDLFKLAEGGNWNSRHEFQGFLPRFLSLTLGSRGSPGSCASLIESLQNGGVR